MTIALDGRPGRIALAALKIAANLFVVLAFAALAAACFVRYRRDGSISALGLLVVNALIAILYVARRDAGAISTSPRSWALAFAASCAPLFMRPGAAHGLVQLGMSLQLAGILLMVCALLSLRRSFGIVPAHRGIEQNGMYRIVRHPLYAAELTALLGVTLAQPTRLNVLLWVSLCGLQWLRARAEESFLGRDAAYRSYCQRVRYRLIPGVV